MRHTGSEKERKKEVRADTDCAHQRRRNRPSRTVRDIKHQEEIEMLICMGDGLIVDEKPIRVKDSDERTNEMNERMIRGRISGSADRSKAKYFEYFVMKQTRAWWRVLFSSILFSSALFSFLLLSLSAPSCSSSTYMSIDSFLLTSFQWEKTLMSMVFLFRRVQCKYPMTRVETIEGLEDSIRLIESHWSFVASHIASHRSPSCVCASIGKIYIWPDMRLVCERMLISITMIIKRKWKWMANAICSFHTDTFISDNVDIDHHHQRKYFLSVCMGKKRWAEANQSMNESIQKIDAVPLLMKHLIDVSISFRFLSSSINLTQPFAWKWLLTPSSRATIFILTCVHARSNLSRWLTMSGLRLSAGEKDNAYKHLTLTISLCDTIELRKTEREPSSLIISSRLSHSLLLLLSLSFVEYSNL